MADTAYEENVRIAAERLGMTVADVEKVMDTYFEVSKEQVQKRREERRKNPVYQQWMNQNH